MWLATKYAAGASLPPIKDLTENHSFSVPSAIEYRQLLTKHPKVKIGPDEDLINHYKRLKGVEQERLNTGGPRPQTAPINTQFDVPSWALELQRQKDADRAAAPPRPSDLKGMPQRIPGWFTGDAMDAPPPDYGRPQAPQPSGRGDYPPSYIVPRPSYEEWLQGLANKGIYVDQSTGRRMTPEQLALPQRRPPLGGGRNVWQDLLDRPAEYAGRHRAASKVVVAYVREKLADAGDDAYAAYLKRQRLFNANNWKLTESGSGNFWSKQINGKWHHLTSEIDHNGDDGWWHYVSDSPHGYAYSSGANGPFNDLSEAMADAEIGPLRKVRFNDKTEPMSNHYVDPDSLGQIRPYRPVGPGRDPRMQTLNGVR